MGTYFSRRNATQPLPPFPDETITKASSANLTITVSPKKKPAGNPPAVHSLQQTLPGINRVCHGSRRLSAALLNNTRTGGYGSVLYGIYGRKAASLSLMILYNSIHRGKEGIVSSKTDIPAGVDFGSTLTDKDGTRRNRLTAEHFNSEIFRV
jgi:hypothetical protein